MRLVHLLLMLIMVRGVDQGKYEVYWENVDFEEVIKALTVERAEWDITK